MYTEPLAPIHSPHPDALAGTPYTAVRLVGRGGMGEVLEAEHLALGKRVVVKLLRPELCAEPSLVERLRIEAQAMARLQNPHVASVHDLGTTPAGRPYFVLEYLEGHNLAEEMRSRGPLDVAEAIRVALDVLDGLSAAHQAGLVHRDVKASNIFLCAPDRHGRRCVKLLDFGVAKVTRTREPRFYPTEEGHFIGSPAVAAPEQARGEAVDGRADLYAVGLLLYTMIAGRSPIGGAGVPHAMLAAQVLTVPPPLSSAAAQPVPFTLDAVVAKALAKAPADRYATSAQMAAALERVLANMDESPRLHAPLPSPSAAVPEVARSYGAAVLTAALAGTLFFALLWTIWRMVRGPS
ncbi:MAG: serine/threonine-protein kinase [Polyangiaceae bacterium]